MESPSSTPQEAEVLRVFQSKNETNASHSRISQVYDLLSDRSEAPMREA